jgi:peptide deformylase
MNEFKLIKKGAARPLSFCCRPIPEMDGEKKVFLPEHRSVIVKLCQILLSNNLQSLASNQIGSDLRVFVTNVPQDIIRVFANPEMEITDFDEELIEESCGSYPRNTVSRYRHRHVSVWYKNLTGYPETLHTDDPKFWVGVSKALSYRIQHEMEHLDGTNVRSAQQMEMADEYQYQ